MDITKLHVKGDRVVVKQLAFEEKIGSFYVPENVRARKEKRRADAWRGEVVSIGDEVYFEKGHNAFTIGDVVFVAPVALDCPKIPGDKGETYIVIRQEDCLAKEMK